MQKMIIKQTFLKHEIKQNRFLNNEGYIFDVEISESILPIIQKVRIAEIFYKQSFLTSLF